MATNWPELNGTYFSLMSVSFFAGCVPPSTLQQFHREQERRSTQHPTPAVDLAKGYIHTAVHGALNI